MFSPPLKLQYDYLVLIPYESSFSPMPSLSRVKATERKQTLEWVANVITNGHEQLGYCWTKTYISNPGQRNHNVK